MLVPRQQKNPATNLHHQTPKTPNVTPAASQGAPDPCPNHPRSGLHEVAINLSHLHPNTFGGRFLGWGGEIHGERKKKRKGWKECPTLWYWGMKGLSAFAFFFSSTSCNRKVKTQILGALQKKNEEILDDRIVGQGKKNTQDRIHLPMCRRSRFSTSQGRDIKLQLTCLELEAKNLMALSTKPPSQLALIPTSAHQSARFPISIFISTKILLERPHLEFTKDNILPSLKRTCPLKKWDGWKMNFLLGSKRPIFQVLVLLLVSGRLFFLQSFAFGTYFFVGI